MRDNKGYASSFILFSLLIVFLLIISILMVTVNNTASLSGKLKNQLLDDIEISEMYKSYNFYSTGNVQEFIAPKDGNYIVKAWSNNNNYIYANIDLNNGDKLYIYVGNNANYNNGMTEIRTVNGEVNDQESISSRILLVASTLEDSYTSNQFYKVTMKSSTLLEDDEKNPNNNGYVSIRYTLSAKNLRYDDSQTNSGCEDVQCVLNKVYELISSN